MGNQHRSVTPISAVRSKLAEAATLWHQAIALYNDPIGFRANLNACIQALRNTTWVLQKHKRVIPDFDGWYSAWQSKMKVDPVMSWLVTARNRIVKEGDLKTESTVRVAISAGWNTPPFREVVVNPLTPTEVIASDIRQLQNIPDSVRQDGVLTVERRWVVEDLPTYELLDVLAYAHRFLTRLVDEAEERVTQSHSGVIEDRTAERGDGDTLVNAMHADFLPDMVLTREMRTVRLLLATGELLVIEAHVVPTSKKPPIEAETLQPISSNLRQAAEAKGSQERALRYFEAAKIVLTRWGYHDSIVILERKRTPVHVIKIMPEDRSGKYVLWERIAGDVTRYSADALVSIAEIWMAPLNPANLHQSASERKDRQEGLQVVLALASGEEVTVVATFHRKGETIAFDEPWVTTEGNSFFLNPVRQVWDNQVSDRNRDGAR